MSLKLGVRVRRHWPPGSGLTCYIYTATWTTGCLSLTLAPDTSVIGLLNETDTDSNLNTDNFKKVMQDFLSD